MAATPCRQSALHPGDERSAPADRARGDRRVFERSSDLEGVDRPEPDEALAGTGARKPNHKPTDHDDREVELDDPALVDPPIDDEDRDPDRREPPASE
jgi:hypothetical protein